MLQVPRRTGFSGPALIRLLTRLTDADVPESRQSLSDRLSLWVGWADAIVLSTVLDGSPPVVATGAQTAEGAEEREYARVRAALVNAIAGNKGQVAARQRGPAREPAPKPAMDDDAEYAAHRQRYLSMQQTMETSIGNLRIRLRAALAARTPDMGRLAVMDAVLDRALTPREHTLLARVPVLLEEHFKRLLQAAQAAPTALDDAPVPDKPVAAATATAGAWLDAFRKDMRSVLLAELDVRLQPVEGLLAALRAR